MKSIRSHKNEMMNIIKLSLRSRVVWKLVSISYKYVKFLGSQTLILTKVLNDIFV